MLKTIKTKLIKPKVEKEVKPKKKPERLNIIVEWGSFIIEL